MQHFTPSFPSPKALRANIMVFPFVSPGAWQSGGDWFGQFWSTKCLEYVSLPLGWKTHFHFLKKYICRISLNSIFFLWKCLTDIVVLGVNKSVCHVSWNASTTNKVTWSSKYIPSCSGINKIKLFCGKGNWSKTQDEIWSFMTFGEITSCRLIFAHWFAEISDRSSMQ